MASLFDKFKQGVTGLKDKAYGAATSVAKNIFGSIPKQSAPTFKSDIDAGFSRGSTAMTLPKLATPPKKSTAKSMVFEIGAGTKPAAAPKPGPRRTAVQPTPAQQVIKQQVQKQREFEEAVLPQERLGRLGSSLFGQFVGAIPRAGLTTTIMPLAESVGLRKPAIPYVPSSDVEKFLFGEDEIYSIPETVRQARQRVETAKSPTEAAGAFGGGALVLGGTILDILPGGGAAKRGVQEGAEILAKQGRKYIPEAIEQGRRLLPEVAESARNIFKRADDVVEDLISPARRTIEDRLGTAGRVADDVSPGPVQRSLELPPARTTDEAAPAIPRIARQVDEAAPVARISDDVTRVAVRPELRSLADEAAKFKSADDFLNSITRVPLRETEQNIFSNAYKVGDSDLFVVSRQTGRMIDTPSATGTVTKQPEVEVGFIRGPLTDETNNVRIDQFQPIGTSAINREDEAIKALVPDQDLRKFYENLVGPQKSAQVTERILREAEGLPADITAKKAKEVDARLKLKEPAESKAAKIAVEQVGPEYAPGSRRIADLFAKSTDQKELGTRGGIRFELGTFGNSHQARKLTENKIDRFPEKELSDTIDRIVRVFRASDDPKMYRFDNLAWVAEMPNGETRVIYTRVNANGAEEIIGWHVLDQTKKAKYLDTLASFGTPAGNRTQNFGLENRGFNPLAYEGTSDVARAGGGGNGPTATSIFPKRPDRELERGFVTSVKESPRTAKEVAETVKGTYAELRNPELLANAQAIIDGNMDEAVRLARGTENTPEANAVGMLLMNRYQQAGDYQAAIDIAEAVARRSTTAGQAIQALTIWGRLTPEGALSYAQRVVDKANDAAAGSRLRSKIKLTPDDAETIQGFAKRIQKMPDGQEKAVEIAKMMDFIASKIPPTLLAKVSTLQTMAQLLNPKTMIRNLVGNMGFAALEQVSDVLGTAVDAGLSLLTKQRSKVLPSLPAQVRGFKQGWKLGLEDALKGIDTSGVVSKFDGSVSPSALEHVRGRVFRSGLLGKAETAMSVALRGTDRAFYQAAFDGTVDNMLRARGAVKLTDVDEPVQRMIIESAHAEALRRTFQDDNALSRMMSRIKKALNGGKEWGVGDLLLKYPKTPAAIIMRGLEYTPAGFAKAAYEAALPLIGGKVSPVAFNQKKFVDAFSRATVGTGILGIGYALANLGILEGKPDKPKDVANLERETGLGDYKINVSALKRFVMGGFSPEAATRQNGDILVSYDWFQPNSIMLAMGANIAQNMKGKEEKQAVKYLNVMTDGLLQGVDTLAEQPLFQGMRQFMQSRDVPTALRTIVTNMPASFVPTFFNQVKQLTDNVSREAYDPNMFVEAKNRAISKIPGLSSTLPERVSVFGETKETYQGGTNNPFNVLLNPAFVSKVQESPEAKLALDLYKSLGETKQVPNQISRTQQAYGESWKLSGADIGEMQRYVGERSKNVFKQLAENERFAALPDETKVSLLSRLLTRFGKEAKAQAYLDHIEVTPPEKVTPPVQAKVLDRVYRSDRFKSASPQQRKVILERVFAAVGGAN